MSAAPLPHPQPAEHPLLALAATFDSLFFTILHHLAAAFRLVGPRHGPAWTRLSRASQRLARILRRLAAGTYPPPRGKHPTLPDAPKRNGGSPAPYLPRRPGWLSHVAGWQLRAAAPLASSAMASHRVLTDATIN